MSMVVRRLAGAGPREARAGAPYKTNHGLPAYDAAKWLAPPPPVRHIRGLPSGATCIIQQGASAQDAVIQEAIVKDRGADSLLLFPDGTGAFDLYDQSRRKQPAAGLGMALMGADCVARWVARPTRARMVQVHFPAGLRAALAERGAPAPFEGAYREVPSDMRALIAAFCADCDRDDSPDLLIETYISLIAQKLAQKPRQPAKGGLATWQLNRISELVRDRLARSFSLAELAAEVRLSPFHFARAFKHSTGLPPHRYVMQRRLEQARSLLETTDLPVTDIAARVGYDDPGYLARLFRKSYGTTPADYRRARR